MGRIRVRHVVTKPSGLYFQCTKAMRAAGMVSEPLPADPAEAVRRAEQLNAHWDEMRRGRRDAPPAALGTFAWLTAELRRSQEWRDKAPRTREDIERALARLEPVFGPAPLALITPKRVQDFYARLREAHGVYESALVMKWFRYLFNFGLRVHPREVRVNPTYAVRVRQSRARRQTWTPDQVRRTVLACWKRRRYGLAVVVAVAYDTGLRPQDIRALTPAEIKGDRIERVLLKTEHRDDRVRPTPLWPETLALIERYRARLGVALPPNLPLVRGPSGWPYNSRHHLAKALRQVLREIGVPDDLKLRDLRRTGNVEAAHGGASAPALAARLHHSIARGQQILDTYTPGSYDLARQAQDARRRDLSGPDADRRPARRAKTGRRP